MNARSQPWKEEVLRKYQERQKEYDKMYEASGTKPEERNFVLDQSNEVEKFKTTDFFNSINQLNSFFINQKEKRKAIKAKIDELDKFEEENKSCLQKLSDISDTISKLEKSYNSLCLPHVSFDLESIKSIVEKHVSFYNLSTNVRSERMKLEEQLMQLTTDMKEIKELVGNVMSDSTKSEADNLETCKICFDAKISNCCAPCGHCFCGPCINKITRCALCRTQITSKIKLYLDTTESTTGNTTPAAVESSEISYRGQEIYVSSTPFVLESSLASALVGSMY